MPFPPPFRFKQFSIRQEGVAHPVGTDSVLLGAWADVSGAERILDIGTGTGVVALMAAQRAPYAAIDAVEMHAPSAACARGNFAASPWQQRLALFEMPVQQLNPGFQYDLIVSNPPFFTETVVSPDPDRRLGRYTETLSPGDLLTAFLRLLRPDGRCAVILPYREGKRFCELAALQGLYCTRQMEVRTRLDKPVERLLLLLERSPYDFVREHLSIYTEGERYSVEYEALTKDFYLFWKE